MISLHRALAFFFVLFLKSGQHLRSQTYKWWPFWWLLEEMPSFWWGKGSYPKVSCFCWKKLFILFFFWVPFVLGRFWTFQIPHSLKVVSFPGNAGSHWSDLNWPVVIRACHWEQPRGMRSMREFGGRSVVGIPWFLHLQAALTWKSTGPRRSVAFKMVSYHGFPLQLFVVDSLFYSKKCISLCLHSRSHDLLSSQGCREVLAR